MIALLAVFVDAIGYILLAIVCVILLIISAHRNAVARRPVSARGPAPTPQTLREFYEEPPPPAPRPKPASAEPVVYMRRWGFRRQKWEAEDKAQWDTEFDRLDHQAAAKARWEEARTPKEDLYVRLASHLSGPGTDDNTQTQREKELFEKLRRNLQNLG